MRVSLRSSALRSNLTRVGCGTIHGSVALIAYINGRAKKAAVRDLIRFSIIVRDVHALDGGSFEVTSRDEVADIESCELFDKIIVATGHFSVPDVPECTGFDQFKGHILHAHDFRGSREFSGKDLLILGTSYSVGDIGSQC